MTVRLIALALGLLFGGTPLAAGQAVAPLPFAQHGDVTLTYDWVRTNAQPGDCGCFGLNGGGISSSIDFRPSWDVVADITAAAGNSLTLVSYQAGLRYRIAEPRMKSCHVLQPFAQVLLGGAHAGGELAGAANGDTGFALRAGVGIDMPVSPRFAVRLIQADYYLTAFNNGINDRQNNLLLGAGIVYYWSRQQPSKK